MKIYLKITVIILVFFLSTGCWNYRELNDLGIVSAISIKKDNDEIELTIQFMNIHKSGDSSGPTSSTPSLPITTITTKGKTIHEALREANNIAPKKPYISHMDLLIIERETAENGLFDIIDYFVRDDESRKQFKVLISEKEKDDDLLSVITLLEGFPSKSMLSSLVTNSLNSGNTILMNYDELISLIYSEGIEAMAALTKILGNDNEGATVDNLEKTTPKANIEISGIAVFKGFHLVGFLNEKESLGINILTNRLHSSIISFHCDEESYAAIEINSPETSFDFDFNNTISEITANIDVASSLTEINCSQNITRSEVIKELEMKASKEIEKYIVKSIQKVQKELNSDVIGIGSYIRKNHNKHWKKLKNNWYEIFPEINFKVNVNLSITKKGAASFPAEAHDFDI